MEIQKHKIILSKILIDIYQDGYLSWILWFKWWTCAMLFYALPRMSIDLDFDLLSEDSDLDLVIDKISAILSKYWAILDQKNRFYTIFWELSRQINHPKIKIEISKRKSPVQYKVQNFLWENVYIMTDSNIYTSKMRALINRSQIATRDIYDIRRFASQWFAPNRELAKTYSWLERNDFLDKVILYISDFNFANILFGLWNLLDNSQKTFAKTKMKAQVLWYLEFLR